MPTKKPSKKASKKSSVNPLILGGILFFLLGTLFKFNILLPSPAYPPEVLTPKVDYSTPKRLTLKSQGIPVTPGGIVNNNWILADNSALFLPTSGKLGEGFNTVIYAHAKEGLFLNLKELMVGDSIQVEDQKGRRFTYKVFSKQEIAPADIDKLKSDIPDTLTLFTCEGWFDESRLLVKAKMSLLKDDEITLQFLKPQKQTYINNFMLSY